MAEVTIAQRILAIRGELKAIQDGNSKYVTALAADALGDLHALEEQLCAIAKQGVENSQYANSLRLREELLDRNRASLEESRKALAKEKAEHEAEYSRHSRRFNAYIQGYNALRTRIENLRKVVGDALLDEQELDIGEVMPYIQRIGEHVEQQFN